jgi:hypothetical protein
MSEEQPTPLKPSLRTMLRTLGTQRVEHHRQKAVVPLQFSFIFAHNLSLTTKHNAKKLPVLLLNRQKSISNAPDASPVD